MCSVTDSLLPGGCRVISNVSNFSELFSTFAFVRFVDVSNHTNLSIDCNRPVTLSRSKQPRWAWVVRKFWAGGVKTVLTDPIADSQGV